MCKKVSKRYVLELCSDLIDDVIKLQRENKQLKNDVQTIIEYVKELKDELKATKKQLKKTNQRLYALNLLGIYE